MDILPNTVLRELTDRKVIKSMAIGRRLLRSGAIKVDGETIKENISIEDATTIRVGKVTIDLTD
jgi:ribosomal 50S subunit-recycling heat shock protein